MQKEYDLTQLKVKRRGLLADLSPQEETATQVAVNLLLDKEIVDFFQQAEAQPNALPYQVQINQMLRKLVRASQRTIRNQARRLG